MINDYIKKLRKAADVLEDLFSSGNPFDNVSAKRKIEKKIHKNLNSHSEKVSIGMKKYYAKKKKAGTKKGFSYKGKHWTQKPENKARVKAMAVKAAATRNR